MKIRRIYKALIGLLSNVIHLFFYSVIIIDLSHGNVSTIQPKPQSYCSQRVLDTQLSNRCLRFWPQLCLQAVNEKLKKHENYITTQTNRYAHRNQGHLNRMVVKKEAFKANLLGETPWSYLLNMYYTS